MIFVMLLLVDCAIGMLVGKFSARQADSRRRRGALATHTLLCNARDAGLAGAKWRVHT